LTSEDAITRDILNGALGEEEQVMSTNQYATFYRINPATAAKAFQHLVDGGVLYKKRGIGMFVSTGARERLRQEHRQRFVSDVLKPLVDEANACGMPLNEVIALLQELAAKEEAGR
jgi:GntR family transcriptional regulator